ncbi:hypothetical protein GGP72_001731 [Salinibacter ruber]|uniref:Polysaccharide pyruvyl transferase domain-containing protein n=1 Tax=Salinibacter ruber TaxID=146919 RepID=A0A9X2PYJ3_9BACT|nr:polysaccharide pyruvyl transferase family protein [Salinibacter ruber]MCS3677802.1 hypothetical protein [Salinibacter ruber]MCS3681090.1 hypothetical protein [Salinibacter ruber]
MVISHHGGGWITNIGNAFIDMGSKYVFSKALDGAHNHLSGSFGRFASARMRRGITDIISGKLATTENVFDSFSGADIDVFVRPGAILSRDWIELHGEAVELAKKKGADIIFHGVGLKKEAYRNGEVESIKRWLQKLNPLAFITRDEFTFENLSSGLRNTYNGIDAGFFVSNAYEPLEYEEEVLALNFDKMSEPAPRDVLDKHDREYKNDIEIVRPHHTVWFPFKISEIYRMYKQYYFKENIFFSDIPKEYIDIYSNSYITFSDRVHACVLTLAYGGEARLFFDTDRSLLFDRVGLSSISDELVSLSYEKIEKEKRKQIDFVESVLSEVVVN